MALGRIGDARATAEALHQLAPADTDIQQSLGKVLVKAGDVTAAERLAEACGDIFSKQAIMRHIAVALHTAGKATEAEEVYRRSLAEKFNNAALHFGLAGALQSQGRTAEAAASFEHAVAYGGSNLIYVAALADARSRLGQRQEALELVEAGLRANPTHPRLLLLRRRLTQV